jgi:hypothetical protein
MDVSATSESSQFIVKDLVKKPAADASAAAIIDSSVVQEESGFIG